MLLQFSNNISGKSIHASLNLLKRFRFSFSARFSDILKILCLDFERFNTKRNITLSINLFVSLQELLESDPRVSKRLVKFASNLYLLSMSQDIEQFERTEK